MAAGQGFKTFTTGEVLTAGDVNGYLMQGINVFASNAARDAAITAPAEGQFAFTKDTNSLWYYDGAAWVASGATGDIEGVTAGVGISGGGTSGTVTVTNSMATAIDAKGDLVVGTGADTFSRIAVGANDTVLTADSTAATGVKWATAASGGMTLISTASPSGATTISFTSIPTTYKQLYLFWDLYHSSSTEYLYIRLNNYTAGDYYAAGLQITNNSVTYNVANGNSGFGDSNTLSPVDYSNGSAAGQRYKGNMTIERANEAVDHIVNWTTYGKNNATNGLYGCNATGIYDGTAAAVSRLDFIRSGTQTITGTVSLYGVN
jgi:hypothetical protein